MYEGVVQDLIDELGRLPGVGPKSAQRIAFHLLQADPTDVRRLAEVLVEVKEKVRFCAVCGRRMVVQVRPDGWWAQCSRHGRVDSADLDTRR